MVRLLLLLLVHVSITGIRPQPTIAGLVTPSLAAGLHTTPVDLRLLANTQHARFPPTPPHLLASHLATPGFGTLLVWTVPLGTAVWPIGLLLLRLRMALLGRCVLVGQWLRKPMLGPVLGRPPLGVLLLSALATPPARQAGSVAVVHATAGIVAPRELSCHALLPGILPSLRAPAVPARTAVHQLVETPRWRQLEGAEQGVAF